RIANRCTNEYKQAKRNFETKLSKDIKKNPKAFYSYVRSNSQTKDKVGPLKDKGGKIITDDLGMCNILNDHFKSVFTVEKDINVSNQLPSSQDVFRRDLYNTLSYVNITEEIVVKYVRKLKLNRAPGIDDLVP